MALLPYRIEVNNGAYVNVDNFMNGTGEAGTIVVYDTSVSGAGSSFDNANSLVKLSAVAAGSGEKPAGMLLLDVVNKDLSPTHLNFYKRETQVGGKGAIAKRGTFVTNSIPAGVNPAPGDAAYFTNGGFFHTTSTNSTRVGTFVSSRNSDGYVKVDLTII